jgi:diguanylate cyclase (GGDEF)-like protein
MAACWSCEAQVPDDAGYCPKCGRRLGDPDSTPIYVVDAATDLFNGVFLEAIAGQEVNRAARYHRALSVMVVEVDHGETLVADLESGQLRALLRELGRVLVSGVRDTDTVGFLDCGDAPRFGVILPETDSTGASTAADKLRHTIASHDFESGGKWQRLTVSCATATANHERLGDQQLITEALTALAAGRQAGAGPNHTFQHAHV